MSPEEIVKVLLTEDCEEHWTSPMQKGLCEDCMLPLIRAAVAMREVCEGWPVKGAPHEDWDAVVAKLKEGR